MKNDRIREAKSNIGKLQLAIIEGLNDDMSVEQKNEAMRSAWRYSAAVYDCLSNSKKKLSK